MNLSDPPPVQPVARPSAIRGLSVLLAGGSGGLGAAAAEYLIKDGARLHVSYSHDRERAQALEPIATLHRADLVEAVDRKRLLDESGPLYGLVVFVGNPARVSESLSFEDTLRQSIDVNFAGPLLLAREAAARMKGKGTRGAIVLLSSMQAVQLVVGSTPYATAKAALSFGARILAKECRGGTDIRVNVVAPGVMDAGMAQASIASGKYRRYLDEDVIPRYGRATDVARVVRFLLEPDCYITGQVIAVDGGLSL
ncbi:MAG: SDR family oxidoreductase [Bryobacterales bacterium]|nr:SDR family oxidoreductase [Bryobacterales bacterium]